MYTAYCNFNVLKSIYKFLEQNEDSLWESEDNLDILHLAFFDVREMKQFQSFCLIKLVIYVVVVEKYTVETCGPFKYKNLVLTVQDWPYKYRTVWRSSLYKGNTHK